MQRLFLVSTLAVMVLAVSGTARAGTFDPANSKMLLTLGVVTGQDIKPVPDSWDMVLLADNGLGGHNVLLQSSVWNTVSFGSNSSIYTGNPVISDQVITVRNKAGSFTSSYTHINYAGDGSVIGPYLGGQAQLDGQLVVWALGAPAVSLGLGAFGGLPGATTSTTILGASLHVTGGPWVTGPIPITGITTNVVSLDGVTGAGVTMRITVGQNEKVLTTGGGFLSTGGGLPIEYHTVTLRGDNQLLSASQSGLATLVVPMRVMAAPVLGGNYPGAAWLDLTFVPEPGTMLLLVSGAIGLSIIGRRRMRR